MAQEASCDVLMATVPLRTTQRTAASPDSAPCYARPTSVPLTPLEDKGWLNKSDWSAGMRPTWFVQSPSKFDLLSVQAFNRRNESDQV